MSAIPVVLLLLAPPVAREPVGLPGWERTGDPLQRRVSGLLAGEPVVSGPATVVLLFARVPSEAGHGTESAISWARGDLRARFLVEDGQGYLRIANRSAEPVLVPAGSVFVRGGIEVAVARDAVVPPDFDALVPAAPLRPPSAQGVDLARMGTLPPLGTGALLAGVPAFDAALAWQRALRGEELLLPVLRSGGTLARRDALLTALGRDVGGSGGTAVGAIFLVGDRPLAAHVFARHDLFVEALPDLLLGLAVAVRDAELREGRALKRRLTAPDARSRAVAWLRGISGVDPKWCESYGAGFEAVTMSADRMAVGHAVVDPQRSLIHAGFFAVIAFPSPAALASSTPPDPPSNPDETAPGVRERKPRPTFEDERRNARSPRPGAPGRPN